MTSLWAALGTEALVLFAVTGTITAVVRNKLKKNASNDSSDIADTAVPAMAE